MLAISLTVVVLALGVAVFAPTGVAYAQELDFDDIGWDAGSDCCSDWGSDYGWGGDDSSCWDCGYGGDSCDWGCGYEGGYGCDWSCGDDYGDYGCDWSCGDDYDYDDCDCYDDYDYDDYDYDEYEETYYDEGCDCYSYSSSGSSGGSKGFSFPSFSSSGFSYVKPMSFGSPSYPVYTPPAKTGGNSSVSNVTNTTITNVDNSINDSFNNYNSGNVYVAPLSYATPQYPVVYTNPAPYCQIYQASSASGYGVNSSYLSWTSSNASSAYLSNVGSVNVNGSTTVWPTHATTYTLTVYGSNGQRAECSTTVQAYSTPYVSLTQIPYTGFDFGTFGNAMYWVTLAAFALGAGYLAVYYIPSLAFAGVRTRKYAPVVAAKAPILVEKQAAEVKIAPIAKHIESAIRKAGTNDSMAIVASKDGSMPKIVISRE